MIENIKTYCLFIVLASFIVFVNNSIESKFLINFLKDNLVTLLIALLAINTTTSSVVLTKLKDISDENKINFPLTVNELKKSVIEQVYYIITAILFLMLLDSSMIISIHKNIEAILKVGLVSVFVASMYSLYDTANSIFIILKRENNKDI